jgi:hypothetical protein
LLKVALNTIIQSKPLVNILTPTTNFCNIRFHLFQLTDVIYYEQMFKIRSNEIQFAHIVSNNNS